MTDLATMKEGNMQGPSYAWVWLIRYDFKQRIVQSQMSGEVETIGHRMHTTSFHVQAPDEASARLAWWRDHRHDAEAKIVSCECLFKLDTVVTFDRPRY